MVSHFALFLNPREKKGKRGRTWLSMTDKQGRGADVRQKTE